MSMMKVVFFGTSSFSVKILETLSTCPSISLCAVVTKPEKPKGRQLLSMRSPVSRWMAQHYPQTPLHEPRKVSTPSFAELLRSYQPDLFIVIAYGEILKSEILAIPCRGSINLHPSLLPKYRGASPIHFTLLNGDEAGGVTIISMSEKMDAGDILAQRSLLIDPLMNFQVLEERLCQMGGELLLELLEQYQQGPVATTPQDERLAIYVEKISPHLTKLCWEKSAEELARQIRAFSPSPGAWCMVRLHHRTRRLKIFKATVDRKAKGSPKQTLIYQKDQWLVGCGEGALRILEVQMEGKNRLSFSEFIQGMLSPPQLL